MTTTLIRARSTGQMWSETEYQMAAELTRHHGEIGWASAVSRQNRESQYYPPRLALRACQTWESLPFTWRSSRSTGTIREGSKPAFTSARRQIRAICRGSSRVYHGNEISFLNTVTGYWSGSLYVRTLRPKKVSSSFKYCLCDVTATISRWWMG